jgi:hypothetical protein
MLSGANDCSEVLPQLLANIIPDLIKAIKDTAFSQKNRIQEKSVVFCMSVGPP